MKFRVTNRRSDNVRDEEIEGGFPGPKNFFCK